MQRDAWYSSMRSADQLSSPEAVGRYAAERALSRLLPRPQFVKFNTDAMLRMDPAGRADLQSKAIEMRRMTVTEARALENQPPLTAEQEAEFARLFPTRAQTQGVNP